MGHRLKVIALSWVTVCTLGAMVSASAPAAQWHVSGTAFSGTETISGRLKSAAVIMNSFLPGGVTKVTSSCTGISSLGGTIFASNKDAATLFTFTGCQTTAPAGCVSPSMVTTKPVISEITTSGELVFDKFRPQTGSEFFSVSLSGSACEGIFHFLGSVRGLVISPGTESTEKGLSFTNATGSELKFAKEPATLTLEAGFSLLGANKGLVWSAKTS